MINITTRPGPYILLLATVLLISGCDLVSNAFEYRDTVEEFAEKLLHENYNGCIDLMAMDNEAAKNLNMDDLRAGLSDFRQRIVNNFGDELNYTFMRSGKHFSTNPSENMPPDTTLVLVQFDNQKMFGVFQVLFDDNSKKIFHINTLDVKEPIPGMIVFWVFGFFCLCILIFNIYVVFQVKKSGLKKKWLKYIAIILLNVPTIGYNVIDGFFIQPLSFQFLFGFTFSFMGYLGTAVGFGVPLGGLYCLWKVKTNKKHPVDSVGQLENEN